MAATSSSPTCAAESGPDGAPGSVLIAVAAWLLALIGGGALFVSFSAQYAYIFTVRRQGAASVIAPFRPRAATVSFSRLYGRPL